jgi:hypothetical protein
MTRSGRRDGDYTEIASRIRDELRFFSSSSCQARHREEWPQLWDALDDLVALVDSGHSSRLPSPRLFQIGTTDIRRLTN